MKISLNVLYVLFFHQILAKGIYYEKTNAIPDQYIIRFKDMLMKSKVVGQVFDPETEPAVEVTQILISDHSHIF
jgi:hypothetical protein